MKGSTGRVFRDRKIDEHKRLDIVRDLSELDDVRARAYLTNPLPSLESRSLCGASSSPPSSTLENLRSLDIETPSCKVVTKRYENEFFERKTFVVPDGYIKASHERQRNPETGLEYDLDEEDEVWLSEREKGSKVLEEDLENMLFHEDDLSKDRGDFFGEGEASVADLANHPALQRQRMQAPPDLLIVEGLKARQIYL